MHVATCGGEEKEGPSGGRGNCRGKTGTRLRRGMNELVICVRNQSPNSLIGKRRTRSCA